MASFKFTPEQKDEIIHLLQDYFASELERELGQFEADFLLDFLIAKLGPHFYNKGLEDAQALLSDRMEQITEAISELEKPFD